MRVQVTHARPAWPASPQDMHALRSTDNPAAVTIPILPVRHLGRTRGWAVNRNGGIIGRRHGIWGGSIWCLVCGFGWRWIRMVCIDDLRNYTLFPGTREKREKKKRKKRVLRRPAPLALLLHLISYLISHLISRIFSPGNGLVHTHTWLAVLLCRPTCTHQARHAPGPPCTVSDESVQALYQPAGFSAHTCPSSGFVSSSHSPRESHCLASGPPCLQ
jgi:hypothetical protein